MKRAILWAIMGCICGAVPVFACEDKKPVLTGAEICSQLESDLVETDIRLQVAIWESKQHAHDPAVKSALQFYEIQDSLLRGILKRYCWGRG